ncbi:restriction endonuclease subunit S [Nitrosomonas sp. Nm166]|uniref:restriction endonuclease subunit S n=1 Tax=Nitrosomonas sp. Nm166 TaxID=1881054 RepID=UPI0008E60EEB|nr:restriction endonuclease subunit S [Nitrosomonas sp. Nm166]SFE12231.1 type I restriction enzyme, S subunit [Nitrosomonas sp. Nm166]
MDEMNLPQGWVCLTLEDVADIYDNLREPVNSTERAKRRGPYPYYGATGQVGWINDYRQEGEFVLLGEDGAPFFDWVKDKAYLVSGKCWVNNHAHVLKGKEGVCSNRYLLYALNQTDYRGYANGTTRLKLTQSAMRRIPINLAPTKEQHRIVTKIEELFSELDKGIESLKTAQAQLKVYRQVLLKHAFEGKLTVQWRKENKDKLEPTETLLKRIEQEREQRYHQQLTEWNKSPSIPLLQRGKLTSTASIPPLEKGERGGIPKPKLPKTLPPLTAEELAELPELPEGWAYLRVGTLIEEPVYGTAKKCDYEPNGLGVLRIPNIVLGKIDATDLKYAKFDDEEISAYKLKAGDILTIRSNGSVSLVGRCALIYSKDTDYLYAGYLIRLRPLHHIVNSVYLLNIFSSHLVRKQIEQKAKSTSGVNNINSGELQSLIVSICNINEQNQILKVSICNINEQNQIRAEIELYLSETDQLDQTITTALQQAETLRQAILKKAFSGQLVPQDPNDEPASELLARIAAEKAIRDNKPKTTRTRT